MLETIKDLIYQGIDIFYVGNQGNFDSMVYGCLKELKKIYPHITICVVLAYLPSPRYSTGDMSHTMYPEGMEECPPQFAIERRNRWMIDHTQWCICYITHTWGGAYKFAKQAKRKKLTMINLGTIDI